MRAVRAAMGLAMPLLVGCANMHLEPSGFLSDFERLEPAPELQVAFIPDAVLWWEKEGLDWSCYTGVVVAPVEWRPVGRRAQGVTEKDAMALCQDFREELSGGLAETGELLAAMSAYREGTPFVLLECFNGHAHHGMEKWTKTLRRLMSEPSRNRETS